MHAAALRRVCRCVAGNPGTFKIIDAQQCHSFRLVYAEEQEQQENLNPGSTNRQGRKSAGLTSVGIFLETENMDFHGAELKPLCLGFGLVAVSSPDG